MTRKNDWPASRQARLEFDGYRCQGPARGVPGVCDGPLDVHHRLPRGRGGGNELENLVTLCRFNCHQWVESNRTAAYQLGLLLRSVA